MRQTLLSLIVFFDAATGAAAQKAATAPRVLRLTAG